jgi:hypothetical protein
MAISPRERLLPLFKQLVLEFPQSFLAVWNHPLCTIEREILSFILEDTGLELPPPPSPLEIDSEKDPDLSE